MRKIKRASVLSALYLFQTCVALVVACQPGLCDSDQCSDAYSKARNASERLRVCIDAIDRGDISEGMSATDLGRILHCEIKPAEKEGALNCKTIRFGDHTVQWYMVIFLDHNAKVVGYYLTNVDAKNGFIGNESKIESTKAAAYFQDSRSERQRLNRCIQIINQKLVWWNMPQTNLENLFGKATDYVERKDGKKCESITFGKNSSAWRFSYHVLSGRVRLYYLSNMNPEKPFEEYWKSFK